MFAQQLRRIKKLLPGYEPELEASEFSKLLEQVNSVRIALGIGEGKLQELPPAVVGDPNQCVLARALSVDWDAHVENEIVTLTWRGKPEEVDWKGVQSALRRRQFKDVSIFSRDDYSLEEHEEEIRAEKEWAKTQGIQPELWDFHPRKIVFETTPLMQRFISAFDEGQFPWLILGKEKTWEKFVREEYCA